MESKLIRRNISLISSLVICALFVMFASADRVAEAVELQQRVLYNFDGDGCMYTKANGEVPTAIDVEDVRRLIAEIAYDGSKVNTMLVCINAQVMYYPTEVGTMRGMLCTPEQRANWPATEIQRFENMNNFYNADIDPYAVMLSEAKQKGLEALLTFRMNDAHGNDFLKTQFWNDHPEYRLGEGLDFWHDEVRDYVFNLIQEAVQRYDCDGIELDFNRFPTFFDTGSTAERIAKINSLTERVRDMLDVEGAKRGKHLILTARVPSNYGSTPPTYETSLAIGCDPVAWVNNGWVDYLSVSEFLFERGDLPIESWKELITTVPVYGGIECTAGPEEQQFLTPDQYRLAAQRLWEKGADGIYLFNFFVPRADFGREPAFEVLADLGPGSASQPAVIARHDGPTDFDGASLVNLPYVSVGDEGTVEFEFKADSVNGCMWYLADVFGGSASGGEYRIFLQNSTIYAKLWTRGAYAVEWEMPFDDTTQWHSIKMSWKEGEDTLITLDGVTSNIVNAHTLEDFVSSVGLNVLGGYPNNSFFYDGDMRNLKVYPTYGPMVAGDANGDGSVNAADAAILATYWQTSSNATWGMGDFNGDGKVDDKDATLMAVNWQATSSASVPEPDTLAMLACVVTAGLHLIQK